MPKEDNTEDFESEARKKAPGLIREFLDFLLHNKKWWMIPILLSIGLIGLLVLLTSTGAAPFIYSLF